MWGTKSDIRFAHTGSVKWAGNTVPVLRSSKKNPPYTALIEQTIKRPSSTGLSGHLESRNALVTGIGRTITPNLQRMASDEIRMGLTRPSILRNRTHEKRYIAADLSYVRTNIAHATSSELAAKARSTLVPITWDFAWLRISDYMNKLGQSILIACLITLSASMIFAQADPLPSWNESASKKAIVAFVKRVTKTGSPDLVPVNERIAVFDNDGTLWAEQPMYFQAMFAIDRVKAMAPQHPEWKTEEPFASFLKGDMKAVTAQGEKGILQMVAATHAGMTTDEFSKTVSDWITTARHPKTGRLYTEMVYQPMLELLAYLRANGFKTFIVSGGGIEFMRPWTERVYGIPPEQVVGSSLELKFEMRDGKPVLVKLSKPDLINDKEGKPVGIQLHIGRRPIAAFGNSDGDLQMLQWTMAGTGARLALIVHHTDAEREWAYDRTSHIGKLDMALDEATAKGWVIVDMEKDWKTIFPRSKE